MRSLLSLLIVLVAVNLACSQKTDTAPDAPPLAVAGDIGARRAQFVPVTLSADVESLAASERQALDHLIAAAEVMDKIFFVQAWRGNPELSARVAALTGPDAGAAKDYYRIMFGPWDRRDEWHPFLGDTARPAGAGFYPEDLTADELDAWLDAHPDQREALTSTVTVIRRSGDKLVAVPYSREYGDLLANAAKELRAAAAATANESLRRFCELRAQAFEDDDYYASDVAWMDLDSPIEVVIGPYETYEDTLFGYKASFESFVCIASPEDSAQLAVFKGELPYLETSLPIGDEYKNPNRGSESPIRVADEVFTAGDTKAGVQTLAFNLPNDERVREAKGSKKVLLKNMMHAKYDAILAPIAGRVLTAEDAHRLDFDTYFHFILFHELSHGLGPGKITKDGRDTEVRLELKDLYSALEEAKADVLGVHTLYQLADKGVVNPEIVAPLPWTYVAGLFRSIRFGATEAHGLGVAVQASYLVDHGAIEVTAEGKFRPVTDRFRPAIEELAHELLMIQATGSYDGARQLVDRYGKVPEPMQRLIDTFDDIPVDIDPVFAYQP